MAAVLLLGNGINRFSADYSWDTLVDHLIGGYGSGKISKAEKPFTLLYEEILSRAFREELIKDETELLSFIAKETEKIEPNNFHNLVLKNYSTILTTNYDYAVEKAAAGSGGPFDSETRETRYSLYRRIDAKGTSVWHIHGEAGYPRTICLGYEHYSAYIQTMRNRLIKQDIERKKDPGGNSPGTWMDYFFDADIDIIGLSLDFVESDLWWLIIHRSRLINSGRAERKNRIRYFIKKNADYDAKTKAKIQMLEANNIDLAEIDGKDYAGFYEKCFG
ncbi:SIR2 family protein [Breznakiella homolactica]|uniref:SIR2 family protein n=1 Tax=Breznakiella homolactica TaxID=2798577 RepID=A0A7T8BA36_9SPIR|nr:SIR2 family protein [Breznakiella homolactica]QQO09122.1 SIR2 family protein [Breznakiella homolactica]